MSGPFFTPLARQDLKEILRYSREQFGSDARQRYQYLVARALHDLIEDPLRVGSVDRHDWSPGLRSWHLRLSSLRVPTDIRVKEPRHLLFYKLSAERLVVIRVLHEAMEHRLQFRK